VRVVRVGLAVVAGVEQPCPGGQLCRHVDDPLTGLEQSLSQRTPDTVRASIAQTRSGHALVYLRMAAYPARSVVKRPAPSSCWSWSMTSMVADSLWGSTPDDDLLHVCSLRSYR
jgi:hypothetical protein